MNAKENIKTLRSSEKNLYIIHYSCQNLNDNNENYSPRITSIAVLHVGSSAMHSFSIHLIAEVNGIEREAIDGKYDELECEMLKQFFEFVANHDDALWLHWNMSNINYGFEALEHRYKVLSQKDGKKIFDSKKYNLSDLLLSVYGKNCVKHPRMASFMELNGGVHRDNLTGEEEVAAFAAKEYVKLHKSTMSKVYWFIKMYSLLKKNKVRVHKSNWKYKVNQLSEHPVMKILGVFAILFSVFQLSQGLMSNLSKIETPDQKISTSPTLQKK